MTFTRCVPTAPALSTELGVRIDQRPVTTTGRFVFFLSPPVGWRRSSGCRSFARRRGGVCRFSRPVGRHRSENGGLCEFVHRGRFWTTSRCRQPEKPGRPGDSGVNHSERCLLLSCVKSIGYARYFAFYIVAELQRFLPRPAALLRCSALRRERHWASSGLVLPSMRAPK